MTVASRIAGRLARLRRPETRAVAVERDLPMLAEAGVTLLADHWYPTGEDLTGVPIVLLRSPYGRRQLAIVGRLFAERGYQVVIQSCRGTFGSGGVWEPFRNERADGMAAHAWLAEQTWWSGRVATFGASYLGLTQWAVATDPPPALAAIAPNVTSTRFRDIVVYPGGSFTLETGATWLWLLSHQELGLRKVIAAQLAARRGLTPAYTTLPLSQAEVAVLGSPVAYYQDWLVHDRIDDDWWAPVDFGRDLSRVPPASLVGGWYDIFLPAQLDDYEALVASGRRARLTVGPWIHASGRGAAAALRDGLDWFDEQLRGRAGRPSRTPVRVWVVGAERWADLPSWPPPATVQRWHLHAGGSLDPAVPAPGPVFATRYRYDPADPTPGVGGPSLNAGNAGSKDQAGRERRADVVTWTSAPVTEAVTVAGPLRATIWIRPSSDHVDVSVRLCRVDAKGRSWNVSDGILRVEPDDGGGVTTPAHPMWGGAQRGADASVRVEVRMWPTALGLRPGECFRLQVASGAHPLFARNPGGGEPLGSATRLVAVDVEVLHDAEHPSAIELPFSSV